MIFLNELENMKIYKKPFYLPINEKHKKNNSIAYLLSPNPESSINILNNPLMTKKYFNSYYIEKDVSYYINQEGYIDNTTDTTILESAYMRNYENNIINESYISYDTPMVEL